MTRQAMVDEERAQLDAMVEKLKLEVKGVLKRESPDFLITMRDGRTIGVEIVRAINRDVASGRGALKRMRDKLQKALEAAGTTAWVSFSINEHTVAMLNQDREGLETEVLSIANLASRVVRECGEPRWYHYKWIDHEYDEVEAEIERLAGQPRRRNPDDDYLELEGTGIKHVDAVLIHPQKDPAAMTTTTGSGQHRHIVQQAIDSKVCDLQTYQQCGADEVWLLVVGSAGTGGALFMYDVEGVRFASPYDRTVFLELFEGRCAYLDTTHP